MDHQDEILRILDDLRTCRIDIKNFGTETNAVEIEANGMSISEPSWFTNEEGKGKVLQSSDMKSVIKIKAINDGNLRISFRGPDKRFNDEHYPLWIDYKSIKIDEKEQLRMPIATWHDKPYHYEMPVKDGQEMVVEIEQEHHRYTKDELKDILEKLYPESKFTTEFMEYWRKNIGLKEIKYTWDYVNKNVLTQDPEYIDINDIDQKTEGRLQIAIGNTKFESILIPSKTKKLYVFLSSNGSKDKYPIFHRISWCDKFDGMCIYLDDPTRVDKKMETVAFYFGSKEVNYADYICEIVTKIANMNNIVHKNIVFISSSNGGFAALYCCNKILGSKCIALNPQLDIALYFGNNDAFERVLDVKFSDSKYDKRFNVLDILNNKESKFFIFSNLKSGLDRPQMDMIFKKTNKILQIGCTQITDNIMILLVDIDANNPHLVQPDEYFVPIIEKIMDKQIAKEQETICNAFIGEMKRFHSVNQQLELLKAK